MSSESTLPSDSSSPYPKNTTPGVRHVNIVQRHTPPHKFIEGRKNESFELTGQNITRRDLLFIRNCSNCTITVSSPIAKLLVGTLTLIAFAPDVEHNLTKKVSDA